MKITISAFKCNAYLHDFIWIFIIIQTILARGPHYCLESLHFGRFIHFVPDLTMWAHRGRKNSALVFPPI